jgi:hypothetical protein
MPSLVLVLYKRAVVSEPDVDRKVQFEKNAALVDLTAPRVRHRPGRLAAVSRFDLAARDERVC